MADIRSKALETALKTLKRRLVQEGVVRDLRRKEFFESKGTVARKKLEEAKKREFKRREEADKW